MKDIAGIVYCAGIEMRTIKLFYLAIYFVPPDICISIISLSILDKMIINYLRDITYAHHIKGISKSCTQHKRHYVDFTPCF